jgi:hypothetical protein
MSFWLELATEATHRFRALNIIGGPELSRNQRRTKMEAHRKGYAFALQECVKLTPSDQRITAPTRSHRTVLIQGIGSPASRLNE